MCSLIKNQLTSSNKFLQCGICDSFLNVASAGNFPTLCRSVTDTNRNWTS